MSNKFLYLLWGLLFMGMLSFGQTFEIQDKNGTDYYPFVKKACILLLGRGCDKQEISEINSMVSTSTEAEQNKELIARFLTSQPSFFTNIRNFFIQEYLEGIQEEDIKQYQKDFALLRFINKDQALMHNYYDYEYNRLEILAATADLTENKERSLKEFQKGMFNNYVYDQINMGIDNFVLSVFQHLLLRKPTKAELEEGKKMCSEKSGSLFFRHGASKDDFLNILVNSDNYYEAQIRNWYVKFFNKSPTSLEVIKVMQSSKEASLENIIIGVLVSPNSDIGTEKFSYLPNIAFCAESFTKLHDRGINKNELDDYLDLLNGFNDQDFNRRLIIKNLLFNIDSGSGSSAGNLNIEKYNTIISDPRNVMFEALPPTSSILAKRPIGLFGCLTYSHILKETKPPQFSFQEYRQWLIKNIPNAPIGREEELYGIARLQLEQEATLHWMEKYPEEVQVAIEKFKQEYEYWKQRENLSDYKDFKLLMINKMSERYGEYADDWDFEDYKLEMKEIDNALIIPTKEEMNSNPQKFITETFLRLYEREPDKHEIDYLSNFINSNDAISPRLIYYVIMTSTEFNHF